jgi:hypothetical protein
MLCFNTAYLCHYRGLKVPLESITDLLWHLWRCCHTTQATAIPFHLHYEVLLKHLHTKQRKALTRHNKYAYVVHHDEGNSLLLDTWDLIEAPLPPTPSQVDEFEGWYTDHHHHRHT